MTRFRYRIALEGLAEVAIGTEGDRMGLTPRDSDHTECGGVYLRKSDHARCRGVYIFNSE